MKNIGIIILLALLSVGGCKTTKETPKSNDESSNVDSVVTIDTTTISNERPFDDNEAIQNETYRLEINQKVINPMQGNNDTPSVVGNSEIRVAHINTLAILEEMPEYKAAEKKLKTYGEELEAQIMSMLEEYQKKAQEFETKQDSMSGLMKKTKQDELLDMQSRIQQFQQNAEQEYANKQNELFAPVMEKMQKAIGVVTHEQGYTYMLDISSGSIVYIGDDAIDATPLVKRKLGIK